MSSGILRFKKKCCNLNVSHFVFKNSFNSTKVFPVSNISSHIRPVKSWLISNCFYHSLLKYPYNEAILQTKPHMVFLYCFTKSVTHKSTKTPTNRRFISKICFNLWYHFSNSKINFFAEINGTNCLSKLYHYFVFKIRQKIEFQFYILE
jgi:hypothetical protein